MKKVVSISLAVILLFSVLSSFSVFAEETYPPVATGRYYTDMMLKEYSFETAGENPEPISLSDSYSIQVQRDSRIIDLNDEALEQQIKEDYSAFINNDVSADKLGVQYFGTLSDGSMLVHMTGPFSYSTVLNYIVIGKYVYMTSSSGNDIKLYKNGTFTTIIDAYQNGDLSDELLDETAEILCFAKFVNPNGEPETEVTTVPETTEADVETTVEVTVAEPETTTDSTDVIETATESITTAEPAEQTSAVSKTDSASTADSVVSSTQDSSGSVKTGYNNGAFLSVIMLVVSGTIFCIVKSKKTAMPEL